MMISTSGDNVGVGKMPAAGRKLDVAGDIYASNKRVLAPLDYTADEQDTGAKWIDGKTIYRKTVTGTISAAGSTRDFRSISYLSGSPTTQIIKTEGMYRQGTGVDIPIGSGYSGANNQVYKLSTVLDNRNGSFTLNTWDSDTRSNAPYYITVYYTRT